MMIEDFYLNLEKRYKNMNCCDYVVMPNHIHKNNPRKWHEKYN